MRTAVVTDSNSGILQTEGEQLGVYVLPMPFTIDGRDYFEDINLTQQEFYEKMNRDENITTSQPSPEDVMKMWDELLKNYDEVVHIPMSSGLSGSCDTARMLAQDYEGKVEVVNNHSISVTQRQSVMNALELSKKGWSACQIKDELERAKADSVIYITVDTLKYLKKGGRITPAAAAFGTLLKIKPVLTILGEKLDAFAKARTIKQAKGMMISAVLRDLELKLGDKDCKDTYIFIAHTQNEEAAIQFREELKTYFPDVDIYIAPLPLSIACHIGPGSLAIAATKKMHI
ncbi:MAG: DegV family protein [Clostridium sp.]